MVAVGAIADIGDDQSHFFYSIERDQDLSGQLRAVYRATAEYLATVGKDLEHDGAGAILFIV
jgi:hypothetical protein